MKSLLEADFYLVEGDSIKATVEALNLIDFSIPSIEAGDALVQIEPHDPLTAPRRGANTNENSLEVYFDFITQDGGADILAYSIEMDSGAGFSELASTLSSPATVVDAQIQSGVYLQVRYRAQNVHGWSTYSQETMIVATTVPDQPTLPLSVAVEFDTKVHLSWSEPANTGGSGILIDGYQIFVEHYDGITYTEVPSSDCDGLHTDTIST
jgi:hypothetical protein